MKKFKRIYLEISRFCNLNCSFCPSVSDLRVMDFENIKTAIDKTSNYTDFYYLHVLGEPTSHPNFEEILDYLDKTDKKVQLVTNGTLLDKFPHILKHNCLRKLSVSIHSIDNVPVKEKYFNAIDCLLEDIDNYHNKALELRFYNNNLNNNSIKYLNKLKEKYPPSDTLKIGSFKLKNNVYIYFQEMFKWPSIKDESGSNIGKCHGGKEMLAILVNGDVTLCCLDPDGHNKIGNIFKQDMSDILNSLKYQKYLSDLNDNKLNLELCRKCTYKNRFKV